MNNTSRTRIPLYALMFALTYSLRTHTMQEAKKTIIKAAEMFTVANQQMIDIARIEGVMSVLRQSNNSPLSKATVTSIQPMLQEQGQSGTKLYKVDVAQADGTPDSWVARLQGSFWTQSKQEKEAEADAMIAGGEEGVSVCPHVLYSDVELGGEGIILMKFRNYGTANNVNWKDKQTYVKLAEFLRRMHKTPSHAYHDPNTTWHSILTKNPDAAEHTRKGYIHRMIESLKENQLSTDFLEEGTESLLTKLQEIYDVLPQEKRDVLVHGDLHSRNLVPLLDQEDNLIQFEAVDWDHVHFTRSRYFDVNFVKSTYVPKKMQDMFDQTYWEGESLDPVEYAYFKVMSAVAPIFFGAAYATSYPTYLAQNFQALRYHDGLDSIARTFMHDGFKLPTLEKCGIFGTALLLHGWQQMDKPEWSGYMETLRAFKESQVTK